MRLAGRSGRTQREIAADLGIGLSTLRRWLDRSRERDLDALRPKRQEREVLKRAGTLACGKRRLCGNLGTGHLGPGRVGLGSSGSILDGRNLVAAKMKEVVDRVVGSEELLCLAGHF